MHALNQLFDDVQAQSGALHLSGCGGDAFERLKQLRSFFWCHALAIVGDVDDDVVRLRVARDLSGVTFAYRY